MKDINTEKCENYEKLLKDSMNIEKDTQTTAEAIQTLLKRHGENPLLYELAKDIEQAQKNSTLVQEIINHLPSDDMRKIFTNRYIHNITWEKTAEISNISISHIHRLHKKGLQHLANLRQN
ncbi:MAG: hypothetical protein FWE33_00705 [Defluviitaleaceae bacterium]|nr:hypothetical protein [Defluviitaleaceae bacterium]